MNLHWEIIETTKRTQEPVAMDLFAGMLSSALATVRRCKTHWELTLWLPIAGVVRQYDTLEAQQVRAEQLVREWFTQALQGVKL